jgi:hypothetical protein
MTLTIIVDAEFDELLNDLSHADCGQEHRGQEDGNANKMKYILVWMVKELAG